MITIPFQVSPTEFSVFVCLKDENIARLRAYDPGYLDVRKFTGSWSRLKLRAVMIGYVSDAEEAELLRAAYDEIPKLLQKLTRGFAFEPEAGDNDLPYQAVKEN